MANRFDCPILGCGKSYTKAAPRLEHINRNHHGVIIPVPFVRCGACQHICENAHGLVTHLRIRRNCAVQAEPAPANPQVVGIRDAAVEANHGAIEVPVVPEGELRMPAELLPPVIAQEDIIAAAAAAEEFLEDHNQREREEIVALLNFYGCKKLYLLNPAWKKPLHTCVINLLSRIPNAADENECYRLSVALFILPGLVSYLREYKKPAQGHVIAAPLETPVEMLRRIITSIDLAESIITTALRYRDIFARVAHRAIARRARNHRITAEDLEKRIIAECAIGRFSKAARTTDELELTLAAAREGRDALPNRRITEDAARNIIAPLFPEGGVDDVLPALPDNQEAARVTPLQVKAAIVELCCDKAPGCSGWTNLLLHTVGTFGDQELQLEFSTSCSIGSSLDPPQMSCDPYGRIARLA